MPLYEQENKETDDKDQSSIKKNPLDYLSEARDLDAQEGVWKASRIMAIVMLVQTMFGLAGLILVYRTHKATQDTFREARKTTKYAALATEAANKTADAAQSAETAYLFARLDLKFIGRPARSERTRVKAKVFISNAGKTPAKDVFLRVVHSHQIPRESSPSQETIDMDWDFLEQLGPDDLIRGSGGYKPEFGRRYTPFLADETLSLPKPFEFNTVLDVHMENGQVFHKLNRPVFLIYCTYNDIFNKPRHLRIMASLVHDIGCEYGNREELINEFDEIEVKYTEVEDRVKIDC